MESGMMGETPGEANRPDALTSYPKNNRYMLFAFKLHQIQTCQNYYQRYSYICCYCKDQIAVTDKRKSMKTSFTVIAPMVLNFILLTVFLLNRMRNGMSESLSFINAMFAYFNGSVAYPLLP